MLILQPNTNTKEQKRKLGFSHPHPYIRNLFRFSSPFPPSTVSISLDFKIGSSDSLSLKLSNLCNLFVSFCYLRWKWWRKIDEWLSMISNILYIATFFLIHLLFSLMFLTIFSKTTSSLFLMFCFLIREFLHDSVFLICFLFETSFNLKFYIVPARKS